MDIHFNCSIEYISYLGKDLYYNKKNHRIIFVFTYSNQTLFAKNGLNAWVIFHLNYYRYYYFIHQINSPTNTKY